MPTKSKDATIAALAEFRTTVEESLKATGLDKCLLGPDRVQMADTFVGILGIHIAEFGKSGLSRKVTIAMEEIETVFKRRNV